MNIEELPVGTFPAPVEFPYFPSRWQLFVWRNWGIVPAERIADVLECSVADVRDAAVALGLNAKPSVSPKWLTHGYLTIIRNNWHLLNYEQLLKLLGWTADKLAYTLKEEDFFYIKLGSLKPNCPPLRLEPLTEEQRKATERIRAIVGEHFTPETMEYADAPFSFAERFGAVPDVGGKDKFEFNFIHSYSASCGDVLGNAETLDPVPENLVAQYASMGIKGVWMHALLYLLCPIPGAEEYSVGAEKRMANLRRIVERCGKYGVKVYLYLNEPRCMPMPFYDKKPEWGGLDVPRLNTKTICTNRSPEPLQWLEGAMRKLFTEAPGLGGVFTITMSENPTNCHYALHSDKCPYCSKVLPEKIIADVICAMERGMHSVAPDAKMICYDWAWRRSLEDKDNSLFKNKVLDLLPKSVYVNSVSEWGMLTHVGGVEQYLVDYSISQVGPSEEAVKVWRHAHEVGIGVAAKVQINNSWELSAVPYIPVPYLIQEHLENLKREGVNGLMLSWTLGGFPGGNLELLKASPEEIAAKKFNPALAEKVCAAWREFSEAFRQFPFNVGVLYVAPQNYGPMNPLHLKPTGYHASMIGYPYDDLKGWSAVYPEDIFERQFKLLTEGWKRGLDVLKAAEPLVQSSELAEYKELMTIAEASYCHFRSTYMQICFTRARDNASDQSAHHSGASNLSAHHFGAHISEMRSCAEDELKTALRTYEIARSDSRIGFEASNHYYYPLHDLREKIINCCYVLGQLR
ncbi:MAG: hypothetical protein J5833_02670 [Victivallales bacterium]|nr:hypothetical protein [Victivallales bacterium]